MTYEATRDLPMTTRTIETPICPFEAPVLAGKKLAIVPILRAGLGFGGRHPDAGPLRPCGPHRYVPGSRRRWSPSVYFLQDAPRTSPSRDVLIVDPMLATGGSADTAITKMKELGLQEYQADDPRWRPRRASTVHP